MATGSYIFDANTETPESVARRRALADALLSHAMQDSQPKSVMAAIGQGIGDLGQAFAARRLGKRADEAEAAGRASVGDLSALFGGGGGGAVGGGVSASSDGAALDTTSSADMAPYQKALLDTIAGTESPGYNVMYGGGRFSDYSRHPNQSIPIRTGPNAGKTSSAAGRYQFLGSTWNQMAQKLGLTDFSPASQDKAAWALASETYRQKTGGDLASALQSGDPRVIAGVGHALSGTWTSLPGGIEQGQGANRFVQAFNRYLGGAGKPTQVASLDPAAGAASAYPNVVTDGDIALPPGVTKPQPYTSPMQGSDSDPAGIGGFTQPPPMQQLAQTIKTRRAAGSGGPVAPQGPGVQQLAQTLSQRGRIALGILNNPWASEGQRGIAAETLKREMEQSDPAHQLALRKAQIELDQLLNPKRKYSFTDVGGNLIRTDDAGNFETVVPGQPKPPDVEEFYDPKTGQPYKGVWNPKTGHYEQYGGVKAPSGTSLTVGPDGTVSFTQGGGKPLTEGQAQDTVFVTRASGALPLIDKYGDALTNLGERVFGSAPVLGNYAKSPEYQQAEQAGKEFLQAILRKDTGAAITPAETEEYGSVYLPRPGDSPELLKQKKASRQRALKAIALGLPPDAVVKLEKAGIDPESLGLAPPTVAAPDAEGWTVLPSGVKIKKKAP